MEKKIPQEWPGDHIKHADLNRPDYGNFHRNEWAILGAPCEVIRTLAFSLTQVLSAQFRIAYADADHHSAESTGHTNKPASLITCGAAIEYTDKIGFHRFDQSTQPNHFQFRARFADQDLVLLNGNHFQGKQQIVLIDPRKEASLQKKIASLTRVSLILLADGQTHPYTFLTEHLAETQQPMPPVLKLGDLSAISDWLRGTLHKAVPPLYGLVLAGGESTRMGMDKSLISYHGVPQKEFAAQMLGQICEKVYISVRHDQEVDTKTPFPYLHDTFLHLGPMGALLSAFRAYPDAAWLAIACDLPLLDMETIQYLAGQRRISNLATAFISPANGFPEPLIAIWEPRSYPVLLQFLSQGYSCPRKVLLNSEVHLLHPPNPSALSNVNFPSEMEEIQKILQKNA